MTLEPETAHRQQCSNSQLPVNIHHLRDMTWQDVERFDREKTVVMIACGPIEQHGPQTPLGTDLYIAEYVMYRCAEHLVRHGYSVIISPTVPYVNALFSLPYAGSVSVRRRVVGEYVFDLLASFAMDGFRHLVLISQHVDPPWIRVADHACECVSAEYSVRAIHGFERLVIDLLEEPCRLSLSGLDLRGDTHAGVYETAPMLYIQEDLVRKLLLEELPPARHEFSEMKRVSSFTELGNGLGYTGDLSQATKEIGKRIIDHYADRFKELILRHVGGEDIHDLLQCPLS